MASSLDSIPDPVLLKHVFPHLEIGEVLALGSVSRRYRKISKDENIWINLLNKINSFTFPIRAQVFPGCLVEPSFNLAKRFVIDLFNDARKISSLKSLMSSFFAKNLSLTTDKINELITAKKNNEAAEAAITAADEYDIHVALARSYPSYQAL